MTSMPRAGDYEALWLPRPRSCTMRAWTARPRHSHRVGDFRPQGVRTTDSADAREAAGQSVSTRHASNSRLQREPAMQRFRSIKTLQKFSSIHPDVHDHFNQERHLVSRRIYKQRRAIALAEWLGVAAYRRLRPERLNLTGGAAHNASRARWKAAYASAYGDGLSALGSWRALTLLIAAAAELRSVCNPRPTAATIADPSVESLMK